MEDLGECELWDRKGVKKEMEEWINKEWQEEWDKSEKGRRVYEVCKEVGRDRLPLSFKGAQLLTGHGNLGEYLARFKLVEGTGDCECGGGVESGEHVIDVCERDDRVRMRTEMGANGIVWASVQLRREGKMDLGNVAIVNDWAEGVLRDE